MKTLSIIFFTLLSLNLHSLTFKSDGSIIKKNGEIIKIPVYEEFQFNLKKFHNSEEILDWPISGEYFGKEFFGINIFSAGTPLPKFPKGRSMTFKEMTFFNGFESEESFLLFVLKNAKKEWFKNNKIDQLEIYAALDKIENQVNNEIQIIDQLKEEIGNTLANDITNQINSEISNNSSDGSNPIDLGGGKDGSPGIRGI